ncbi:protein FAM222B isoform X1 [Pleuronectes platessa]|uniref:protein FAM222B isoform X1 n=1 Tax=Pleuronectes platessa TaxID=8262 RepID=UPI00232A5F8B|nr:protein FAM222B isoform X1 [Pleuronectes platessa]XP_053298228.1 protein FAM222B isoform X1 [Pleuronectes platessa]XP_053298229.1 protein FAM222B isoform X1 [Pleuronectes platessa]
MLACLPVPGDLPLQLLPHTQMNTGLQKWDTTQRMRSTPFPTPAELDAYAKKVANHPLTIKIFPNSVKVPQRNHVRRTVNGLDTSGQRYSPYPSSQVIAKTGLLAIIKGPTVKGVLKDFDGSRARLHPEVIMNHPTGPYQVASTSTLNHHPPLPNLHLTQHNLTLQQQDPPQALQMPLPQHQGHTQSLRHPPHMAQHPQGPPRLQTMSQHPALGHPQGPPTVMLQQQHLQQQQQQQQQQPALCLQGGRKPPDGDAPPNVTVSTSTIPLSMATGLHPGRQADLSTIVHQINQFCQARAQGAGATSMCEGQIANPSPISRNLLISACSRVSMHSHPGTPGFPPPNCIICPQEKATVPIGAHLPPGMTAMNHLPSSHSDLKQQHQLQHHLHQQQNQQQQQIQHNTQQQKMLSWNPHQMAHVPHIQNGGTHICKQPSRDPTFHFKGMGYPAEICGGQPYTLKPPVERPTPSPPVNNNCMPGPMAHYTNGHYFQSHIWNSSILPTPNSDSSGSQDIAMPFHGAGPGGCTTLDCGPPGATHYRLGASSSSISSSAQTTLIQTADYLGGDFQTPYFCDQNLGLMGKMHRPSLSRVGPEVGDGRTALIQHPGYR